MLFSVVNVARHAGINPEMALRGTVDRFMRRFAYVEDELGDGWESSSLEVKEALWQQAKGIEGAG